MGMMRSLFASDIISSWPGTWRSIGPCRSAITCPEAIGQFAMTFSAQPMSTRGTSTTPPPPLPSSAPLASIGSVRELTEHHEVPSLKQLSLAELDVGHELRNACRRGDIELIKILVREGADPNSLVENCYENIADPIPILAYGCIK